MSQIYGKNCQNICVQFLSSLPSKDYYQHMKSYIAFKVSRPLSYLEAKSDISCSRSRPQVDLHVDRRFITPKNFAGLSSHPALCV